MKLWQGKKMQKSLNGKTVVRMWGVGLIKSINSLLWLFNCFCVDIFHARAESQQKKFQRYTLKPVPMTTLPTHKTIRKRNCPNLKVCLSTGVPGARRPVTLDGLPPSRYSSLLALKGRVWLPQLSKERCPSPPPLYEKSKPWMGLELWSGNGGHH